jgi:hypothetical protein
MAKFKETTRGYVQEFLQARAVSLDGHTSLGYVWRFQDLLECWWNEIINRFSRPKQGNVEYPYPLFVRQLYD